MSRLKMQIFVRVNGRRGTFYFLIFLRLSLAIASMKVARVNENGGEFCESIKNVNVFVRVNGTFYFSIFPFKFFHARDLPSPSRNNSPIP